MEACPERAPLLDPLELPGDWERAPENRCQDDLDQAPERPAPYGELGRRQHQRPRTHGRDRPRVCRPLEHPYSRRFVREGATRPRRPRILLMTRPPSSSQVRSAPTPYWHAPVRAIGESHPPKDGPRRVFTSRSPTRASGGARCRRRNSRFETSITSVAANSPASIVPAVEGAVAVAAPNSARLSLIARDRASYLAAARGRPSSCARGIRRARSGRRREPPGRGRVGCGQDAAARASNACARWPNPQLLFGKRRPGAARQDTTRFPSSAMWQPSSKDARSRWRPAAHGISFRHGDAERGGAPSSASAPPAP